MQDPVLVFDVLIVAENGGEERTRFVEAFRTDPHLRVFATSREPAPVVLDSLQDVDLIVAVSGDTVSESVRRMIAEAPTKTGVILCRPVTDQTLLERADAVVLDSDPSVALLTARWLLGLPSRVVPARRTALRRMMRSS